MEQWAVLALPAIFALTSAACSQGKVSKDGLYVYCDGAPDGLYYENTLHGRVYRFSLPCVDPTQSGETEGIDLDEWTNDNEEIHKLTKMCVQDCDNVSPGALGNPWESSVIPPDSSPKWPRTGQEVARFVTEDSEFVIGAHLDYDTLLGSPPVADHGLSRKVEAPYGPGLPISSLTDDSWDPDGDINEKIWFVDGRERSMGDIIPAGMHTIGLRVIDGRGALDFHESSVMIEAP